MLLDKGWHKYEWHWMTTILILVHLNNFHTASRCDRMSDSEDEEPPVAPPGKWICMGVDSDDERCGSVFKDKKDFCAVCGTSSKHLEPT